jgi:hypothetical protein
VTRHSAVLGSTGSGKSNTVAAILRGITSSGYPSARIVVVDPHGEYGTAFGAASTVFRIGDATTPLIVPYWALSFDELAWFLVDRRSASESAPDTKLREMIYEGRRIGAGTLPQRAGVPIVSPDDVTPDSPVPFDVRRLWYDLDRPERVTWADNARTTEALVQEGDAATLRAARFQPAGAGSALPHKNTPLPPMGAYAARVLTRLKDKRFAFLLSPGQCDGVNQDLHSVVSGWMGHDKPITVLDLAGVPSEIIDLVVGL